jgi:ribonuclease HI
MSGKTIKIFTDGSFKKLKNNKALCGYGIYFPNGELDNVSRPFIHEPLTNQRAELYAILKSLRNLEKYKVKYDELIIYTDSEYSIKSLTIWYKNWEQNKWKNAKGQAVMNQDIIRPIINILKANENKIKFKHVNSHTGKQDFESLANEMADKLANEGAMKTILK